MAGKKTKCHQCNIVDDAPKIIDEDNVNKRYHATCAEVARKRKEFLKKEKEQKDELFYKLLKIHGLRNTQEIPPFFYQKVEEVRNDTTYYGHNIARRYKQGLPYNSISYAYDYCQKRIEDFIKSVQFESKLHEMLACLTLTKNHFADAYNHAVQRMSNKEEAKKISSQKTEDDMSIVDINKNNKADDMDISSLL